MENRLGYIEVLDMNEPWFIAVSFLDTRVVGCEVLYGSDGLLISVVDRQMCVGVVWYTASWYGCILNVDEVVGDEGRCCC